MVVGLDALVEAGDPDEVLREVDRRCATRDWAGLVELRDRCRLAVERGKQLWGAAAHAEYRLALEAPSEVAALVVTTAPPAALGPGPLPEVLASSHEWEALAPWLGDGPERGAVAYECVVRGADLEDDIGMARYRDAFELPLALQAWEPAYALAEYRADGGRFPRPPLAVIDRDELPAPRGVVERSRVAPEGLDALRLLVSSWVDGSEGRATMVAVEGGLTEAAGAIGAEGAVERIAPADALALLAWVGASGGAHGRRAGAAAGRAKAWWAAACMAGIEGSWPCDPRQVGDVVNELEWWTWGGAWSTEGFRVQMVVVDPADGVAFGFDAQDAADPGVVDPSG